MTNTIPNVPRELEPCPFCGSEAGRATKKATWNLSRHRVACTNSGCGAHYGYWHPIEWNARALLSAPSPAGVDDGLEVVGWYRMDGRKAITPYPSVCATWHKMGVKVGAAYSDSAHAIIDGLRGESEALHAQVKVLQSGANSWQSGYDEGRRMGGKHCALTIDQHAQRIGELEGLLRDSAELIKHGVFEDGYCCCGSSVDSHGLSDGHYPVDALAYHAWQVCERIDAALPAGKDSD